MLQDLSQSDSFGIREGVLSLSIDVSASMQDSSFMLAFAKRMKPHFNIIWCLVLQEQEALCWPHVDERRQM